ncbi:hypothetical protein AAY473_003970 [Plecturocebus cupreus]
MSMVQDWAWSKGSLDRSEGGADLACFLQKEEVGALQGVPGSQVGLDSDPGGVRDRGNQKASQRRDQRQTSWKPPKAMCRQILRTLPGARLCYAGLWFSAGAAVWVERRSFRQLHTCKAHLTSSARAARSITGTHHHPWLIFVFFVEIGFHHVGKVGLELLTSGDLPTLASQSAGITGWSAMARFQFTATSVPLGSSDSPTSASQSHFSPHSCYPGMGLWLAKSQETKSSLTCREKHPASLPAPESY